MKKNQTTQVFGLLRVLLLVLVAVMALSTVACGESTDTETQANEVAEKTFTFEVTTADGKTETFTVTSSRETVGEALMDEGLIEGEEGAYGLYVKKVNGVLADYDVDGTYWAFYVDGAYAASGVDTTPIEQGKTYAFKVEK